MPDEAKGRLVDHVAYLFAHGDYTDLTIKCGDREWKVHKCILVARVKIFDNGSSGFPSDEETVVDLTGEDPAVIDAMLRYYYTARYDVGYNPEVDEHDVIFKATTTPVDDPLQFTLRVVALAFKWDSLDLIQLAGDEFTRCAYAEDTWNSTDFALAIEQIYSWAIPYPNENSRWIMTEMKESLVYGAATHARELYTSAEFGDDFRRVVKTVPEFASDLLKNHLRIPQTPE